MNSERFKDPTLAGNYLSRRVAAFSIAVPLLFGAAGCTSVETPSPYPTYSVTPGPKYLDTRCEVIPQKTIDETQQVFASTWQKFGLDQNITGDQIEQYRESHRLAVAAELELTVFDYKAEYKRLADDIYSKTSTIPTKEYFDAAQEFLSRYGVKMVFDSKEIDKGTYPGVTPYTQENLVASEDIDIKRQLYGFITSTGELPVELVKYMGLKNIVMVHIENTVKSSDNENVAGFAEVNSSHPDTIYVDPTKPLNYLIPHEMFHLWDANVCGALGMMYDKQFNALNPKLTSTDTYRFYAAHEGYLSSIGVYQEENKEKLFLGLQLARNDAEKAAAQAKIDALKARVAVAEDYGFVNVEEDKATIGQEILSFSTRINIESVESPILQKKALLLVARLYEDQPKVVEYLARTGVASFKDTNVLAK